MDPLAIIKNYYEEGTPLYQILVTHSELVAQKALGIARSLPELHLDERFIYEAAMLHDIGIYACHAPKIHCHGMHKYIEHGVIGASLLRPMGYERHALVCERHTGAGITKDQVIAQSLPLPIRDYLPLTLEEQLICFADKFYSKTHPTKELTVEQILVSLSKFGSESVARFEAMKRIFM